MVVLLAIAGLVAHGFDAESSRPKPSESKPAHQSVTAQDVDARLWQDPLATVAQYRKQESEAAKNREELRNYLRAPSARSGLPPGVLPPDDKHLLRDLARPRDAAEVTVLGAMVYGGQSEEDAEMRRRTRYAVVSALMDATYEPDRSSAIGYVYLLSDERKGYLPELIPYEWFSKEETTASHSSQRCTTKPRCDTAQHMLVLWLDQQPFEKRPLASLKHLAQVLNEGSNFKGTTKFRTLGPLDSFVFQQLAQEIEGGRKSDGDCDTGSGHVLQIVSASATATLTSASADMPRCQFLVEKGGVQLLRVIGPDINLTRALVDELDRRTGFVRDGYKDVVIALHEGDTTYGRDLGNTFAAACMARGSATKCPRVRPYSYLRGLDGQTLTSRPVANDEQPTGKGDARPAANTRSNGDHETDYLRRLVASIKQQGKSNGTNPQERVVGVFLGGNDVYDKLLLLRALKPEFPEATFLTTDLDARLLDAEESRWARNLVVATNYGLSLNAAIQPNVPPLRDNYQTATYLAAYLLARDRATDAIQNISSADGSTLPWLKTPLLFEIGRTRPIPLTDSKSAGYLSLNGRAEKCGDPCPLSLAVQPDYDVPAPKQTRLWTGLALILGLLFVCLNGVLYGQILGRLEMLVRSRPLKELGIRILASLTNPGLVLISIACIAILLLAILLIGRLHDPLWTSNPHLLSLWALVSTVAAMGLRRFAIRHDRQSVRLGLVSLCVALYIPFAAMYPLWHWDGLEPFEWFQGVSAWPSHLLRFIACMLAIWGFWDTALDRHRGSIEIEERFCLSKDREASKAQTLWLAYKDHASRWFFVSVCFFLAFVAVLFLLSAVADQPMSLPVRGITNQAHVFVLSIYPFLLGIALLASGYASCLALNVHIIDHLKENQYTFSDQVLDRYGSSLSPTEKKFISRFLSIDLVARQSERILKAVYYPFAVLAILLVARSSLFDSWPLTVLVILVFGLSFCGTVGCVAWLRRKTYVFHQTVLREMRDSFLKATGDGQVDEKQARRMEQLLENARSERRGSFQNLAGQPLLKALLLPIGGASGIEAVEHLLFG